MRRTLPFAALLLALLTFPAAQAGQISTSQLSNFRYVLEDLRPDDGTAAGISFNFQFTDLRTKYGPCCDFVSRTFNGEGPAQLVQGEPGGVAKALFDGAAVWSGLNTTGGMFEATSNVASFFTLAPYTRVTFLADWEGSLQRDNDLTFGGVAGFLSITTEIIDYQNTVANLYQDGVLQQVLSIALESGEADSWGLIARYTTTHGWDYANPAPAAALPLPGTIGMMLGGLGVMGALRRRRSQ